MSTLDTEAITARLNAANAFIVDKTPGVLRVGALTGDIAALLAEVARLKAEIEAEHLIREAAIAAQDSAMQLVAGLRAALQAVGET